MVLSHSSPYETSYASGNRAEQDPLAWWKSVCESSRAVLSEVCNGELAAVSFSGQMSACLPVDKNGRPLMNALIYCDQRAEKQNEVFIDAAGFDQVYQITGHRASATYPLQKLMWIRDERPEVYRNMAVMLQAKDFMNYKLTGRFCTEPNDASGTGALDLVALKWSSDLLESADVEPSFFPEIIPSIEMVGTVSKQASEESGIPEGTPVIAGAGDGGCATVGAGSISPGDSYCYMGSSSWVSTTTERPLFDPDKGTFTFAHPVPGLYHPCGTMQTAGNALNWFSDAFKGTHENGVLNEIDTMAAQSSPRSGGLIFLPYLMGERSPWWDSDARGSFIGMTMTTSQAEICRSVQEGILMNLNCSLQVMKTAVSVDSLTFIGGGARSLNFRQLMADVFQVEIEIPLLLSEATSMGAAAIGGVGCGLYEDFNMARTMNPPHVILKLNRQKTAVYARLQDLFMETYQRLRPIFGQLKTM